MDIFQTDKWFSYIVPTEGQSDGAEAEDTPDGKETKYDEALNTFFDLNSYGSMAVINNLGSTAIFISVFIFLHIAAFLL